MKERPILFNGEMVMAILDGRKTQTRRVVKPQPEGVKEPEEGFVWLGENGLLGGRQSYMCGDPENPSVDVELWQFPVKCPYGAPGDRLWVRETFCHKWDQGGPVFNEDGDYDQSCLWYRATTPDVIKLDEDCEEVYLKDGSPASPWLPSIHMPRWASRILLEITGVRVERVQEISNEDAIAEGINCIWRGDNGPHEVDQTQHVKDLWDSINAKRGFGWDVNPWVWSIEFKVIES